MVPWACRVSELSVDVHARLGAQLPSLLDVVVMAAMVRFSYSSCMECWTVPKFVFEEFLNGWEFLCLFVTALTENYASGFLCVLCATFFCKEFPRFDRPISANLG